MSNTLLNTLLEKINSAEVIEQDAFCVLDFEIINLDLINYLSYFNAREKFYFKDKEANTEILGLNIYKTITDISKSIKANPNATIISFERFSQSEKPHELWDKSPLGHHYFKICFIKKNNKTRCQILIPSKNSQDQTIELIYDIHHLFSVTEVFPSINSIISSIEIPTYSKWDEMIGECHKLFHLNELTKIVLNRNIENLYNTNINPYRYFIDLSHEANDSYNVFIKLDPSTYFMSVTPERLLKIKEGVVEIDSLAGTAQRDSNIERDQQLAQKLLNDPKELREHEIVTDSILNTIKKYSNDVSVLNERSILKLKFIQHIHSKITAKISMSDIANLKDDLHPTPAVGGHPKQRAIEKIKEIEPVARGLYASAIGYYTSEESEICVGIRSALIRESKMTIYGGCGIVPGSNSHSEWLETKNKMKNFESVIG